MAKTKQFTIPVDNQPGAVARIARALGHSKVNILALMGTAQGMTGTVELVAEDAKKAKKALDEAGISYQETAAEQHELPNKAGALAQYLLHPRHGRQGREESRGRLYAGSRTESGDSHGLTREGIPPHRIRKPSAGS